MKIIIIYNEKAKLRISYILIKAMCCNMRPKRSELDQNKLQKNRKYFCVSDFGENYE